MSDSTTPTTRSDCTVCIDPDDILDALEWNRSHVGQWKEFRFAKPLEDECVPQIWQRSDSVSDPDSDRIPFRVRPAEFIQGDSQFIMSLPDSAMQLGETVDPDWDPEASVSTATLVDLRDSITLEDVTHRHESAIEVSVRYTTDAALTTGQ